MSKHRRVIVAEPDDDQRHRLANVLRALGKDAKLTVAIDHATDGTTALAMAGDHRPDLIVAEVLLEGISGLALMRRLKNDLDRPPAFVFVTDIGREADRYWGLRSGAHAYLVKPVDDEQLAARLRPFLLEGPDARPQRAAVMDP